MVKTSTVAVEFDGPLNQNFRFAPLQQTIRGRFDFHRIAEPNAGKLLGRWPAAIPSQVLEFDCGTGEGAIVEPLYEARYTPLREKIEGQGQQLPAERQPFKVDAATFVYWLSGLVETGDAKILQGELPKVSGSPRMRFHSTAQVDPLDRLTAQLERQNELQSTLIESLAKLLGRAK
jgi:hypothetical protein